MLALVAPDCSMEGATLPRCLPRLCVIRSIAYPTPFDLDCVLPVVPKVWYRAHESSTSAVQRNKQHSLTAQPMISAGKRSRVTSQPWHMPAVVARLPRSVYGPRQLVPVQFTALREYRLLGTEPALHSFACCRSVQPGGVREMIHALLARLAPTARKLLVAGSLFGQRFTFHQLCGVAGLSEEDGLPAIDDVMRVHLLRAS